jgi:hypothetical protein
MPKLHPICQSLKTLGNLCLANARQVEAVPEETAVVFNRASYQSIMECMATALTELAQVPVVDE